MRVFILLYILLYPFFAISGVIPEHSRIIFHGKNTVQSSVLVNTNNYPVVVQLWVDDGEFNTEPEQTTSPFVVTPVISRMDPLKINEMKLIFSGEKNTLSNDRESLFWLNILEVPPVNKNPSSENEVTLSMLTQIKLIYRPEKLEIDNIDLMEKLKKLTFQAKKKEGNTIELTVSNPTEYVASLSAVSLLSRSNNSAVSIKPTGTSNSTLLPKSSITYHFDNMQKLSGIDEVEYWIIDDSGKFLKRSDKISVSK